MGHDPSMERLVDRVGRHWEARRQAEAAAARAGQASLAEAWTVALAREAGTQGTAVGHEVGRRLGWPVYDHELLERIAQEMGLRTNLLESVDERWPNTPGCRAGQESWRSYVAPWMVLAGDEDEAARLALSWQEHCYPSPAQVVGVEMVDDGYTDKPGVISQGFR